MITGSLAFLVALVLAIAAVVAFLACLAEMLSDGNIERSRRYDRWSGR